MEIKDFTDYDIADISEEDLRNICELEKTISTNTKEEVVLIAYKHKPSEKSLS
jgi:phosphoenolpyruvate-protein kinase (PTS system EI component)